MKKADLPKGWRIYKQPGGLRKCMKSYKVVYYGGHGGGTYTTSKDGQTRLYFQAVTHGFKTTKQVGWFPSLEAAIVALELL